MSESAPNASTIGKELARLASIVERRMEVLIPPEHSRPQALHRSMRYSLLAGGKRLRPAIAMLCAGRFGGNEEDALDAACAVEMVHTASLILDDLPSMDDATLRRGHKVNHLVFGEDIAILAAVCLLNRAFGVIARCDRLSAEMKKRVVDVLSTAIGSEGVIAGQTEDLIYSDQEIDFSTLEYIHRNKTGALFIASAEIGARVAGLGGNELEPVRAYAKNLGLAFQILDDLIDVEQTSERSGKDVGQDAKKTTFVSFSGRAGARALAEELIQVAVAALAPFGPAVDPLRQIARSLV